MPQYSNSPLGLVLTSESTDSPVVGSYVLSGTSSSQIASIFFDNTNAAQSYSFDPNVSNLPGKNSPSTYNSDISTLGIINYTSTISSMKLKYADFAYLKNLGVFPNNRLIIARRFSSPVVDNLLTKDLSPPVSTLVSWVADNTNFIDATFAENWVEGEVSFRKILNELGDDILMGDNSGKSLGNFAASGGNAVPLPGFTEGLQYEVFKALGYSDLDASQLPYGNPNIIRQSKRRATPGKEESFSGIKCKFKIKMVVEYEQKFINGVDPTTVYYDIIANALTFGASEAQFQFNGKAAGPFKTFIDNMGSGNNTKIKTALLQFIGAISDALHKVGNDILSILANIKNINPTAIINSVIKVFDIIITGLVNKYKLKIVSVVNALTGSPSAPWHVTIGNPRRPIFSSGDMVNAGVTITMGKSLAFNDLPSSIKLEFELESARDIGADEIFKKFNCGRERTYIKSRLSFVDTDITFNKNEIANAGINKSSVADVASSITVPSNAGGAIINPLSTQIAKSGIYPSALTGLPNASGIIDKGVQNNNGTTTYGVGVQAPISQLGKNANVIFWPNYSVTSNGTNIGNWQPTTNSGAIINLNPTGTATLNNNGYPGSTITLPGTKTS